MNSNRLWILGAADVEMAAIERLLTEAGEQFAYAAVDGVRVHPGNAYKADGITSAPGAPGMDIVTDFGQATELAFVECEVADLRAGKRLITVIDHHRPGDPGYGKGPEDFLAAASIGQVWRLLQPSCFQDQYEYWDESEGWLLAYSAPDGDGPDDTWSFQVPQGVVFTAAADHCLEAAYRGRCPGVDPDALMRWRAESRAAFQGRTVEAVMADVEAARKRLRRAMECTCSECSRINPMSCCGPRPQWADLREVGKIPELPEAAAREGIPFLAKGLPGRPGRVKIVLQSVPQGSDLVQRFLAGEIVPDLVDMYGDPARGFAGGYNL